MYPLATNRHRGDRPSRLPPARCARSPSFPPKKSSVLDRNITSSVSNAVSHLTQLLLAAIITSWLFSASCNTLLNSGNVNEHEKKIYCVGCYRRQFGPQGGECLCFVKVQSDDVGCSGSWLGNEHIVKSGNTTDQSKFQSNVNSFGLWDYEFRRDSIRAETIHGFLAIAHILRRRFSSQQSSDEQCHLHRWCNNETNSISHALLIV